MTDSTEEEAEAILERHLERETARSRAVSSRLKTTRPTDYERLGRMTGAAISKAVEPLLRRIDQLEKRPTGVDYRGVWRKGCSYSRNMAVSHSGSLWIAIKDYPEKEPGDANSGFRLAVKKGRDGKDLRK